MFRIKPSNYLITNRIVFAFLFLCLYGTLNAAYHSIITMKNGSIIEGDVILQSLGNEVTIEAEKATFVIEPKDIVSKKVRKVKYDDLSREMKRWVLENRALKGDAYGRYAELEDIKTKKCSYTGLVKKEQNGRDMYFQVSPTILNIRLDEIQSIDKTRSTDVKYNLTDKVTTFAGNTYEGKIVSQKIGESLTIETSKGRIEVPNNEIMEIRKSASKESNNPLNEIDFITTIVLSDGKEKEGLVSTQHYGKKAKDNYITFLDKSGKSDLILMSSIKEQRTKFDKHDNPPYAPGKVYVNEFKINNARSQRISNDIVFLDKQVFPFPEGISITFKSDGISLTRGWSLVALSELPISEGKSSWGYRIDKKVENTIPYVPEDHVSQFCQITYGYLSPGYYALVNDTDTEAFVFKITK